MVLEPIVQTFNKLIFANKEWTFQKDSAPAYKTNKTQLWP